MVRKLPVIQNSTPEAARTAWQWVAAGAAATVAIWVPLALLALPLGASAVLGVYSISNGLSGAILKRFGRAVTQRHVLSSATLATTLCLAVALLGTQGVDRWFVATGYLVMLALALPSAWLGARLTSAGGTLAAPD